jgi:ABC-type uncharacterized transport system substrate-binding protein
MTAAVVGLSCAVSQALAHPHVWVTMKETVLYDKQSITGLQQAWTFDEIYTQQAIEGLDKNGDGKYDREELKELAQVNIDGLKEFQYFTFAELGDKQLKFNPPVDYWLEYTEKGILTLHFTLPLEQPVPADATGFNFAVFDSSYFIAFDFAEADPIKLGANAPATCKPTIHEPPEDADTQQLSDAFSNALGQDSQKAGDGGPMSAGGVVSIGSSRRVAIECTKS